MADRVAGERTPTKAAYDDRDLLAEALKQLYVAANEWRGEPALDPALDAAREALSTSHWPTRWQASAGGGAGERTWTIYVCPDHGFRHRKVCSWPGGLYPVCQRLCNGVVVVELSRLRAAEEERDQLLEGERGGLHKAVRVAEAERDRLAEALREIDTQASVIALNSEDAQARHQRIADLAREALASLEQKEDS